MKATNIKWDTDNNKKTLEFLPTEVEIPKGMTDSDEISNWLSETYDFCHFGFDLVHEFSKEEQKPMKTLLGNAIIAWFEDSIYEYKDLKDESFIKKVCSTLGITEDLYSECVLEVNFMSDVELINDKMASSEIYANLSPSQRDDIYRMKHMEYVEEDVRSRIEENYDTKIDKDDIDSLVSDVANAYVYHCKYDCELSYWDNIDNLIERYL